MPTSNPIPPPPPPLDSPDRKRLPPLLRKAWYGLNQAFRRRIAHTHVTPDQFTVMRILLESDPAGVTQRELASTMSSDPNTVASLLERMEASSLITRRKHESDRRAHRIQLGPAAPAKYADVRNVALELQKEILRVLPREKHEEFLQDLNAVADACWAAAERSSQRPNPQEGAD